MFVQGYVSDRYSFYVLYFSYIEVPFINSMIIDQSAFAKALLLSHSLSASDPELRHFEIILFGLAILSTEKIKGLIGCEGLWFLFFSFK